MVSIFALYVAGATAFAQAPDDFIAVTLIDAKEHKAKASWQTPNQQQAENKHVFALTFRGPQGQWPDNLESLAIGVCISAGSQAYPAETGSQPSLQTWPLTQYQNPPNTGTFLAMAFSEQQSGQTFDVHLVSEDHSAQGALSGATLIVMVHREIRSQTPPYQLYDAYERIDYAISKLECGDVAVDSRKVFVAPNAVVNWAEHPELIVDPNAGPRDAFFAYYTYRGGLFTGRMDWGWTRDQSGRALIQLTADPGTATDPRLAVLTMLYLGKGKGADENVSIGAYFPKTGTDEPNLTVPEGQTVWSTRWASVRPRPVVDPEDPQGENHAYDAVSKVTFTSSSPSVDEYVNWSLKPNVGGYLRGDKYRVAVCFDNWSSPPTMAWRYFASKEFEMLFTTEFPFADSKPRVWDIRKSSYTSW